MKVDFPRDSYLKSVEVNDGSLDISFGKKKKIALLFISLNPGYWPYLAQVIKDARKNFLLQHHVDFFVWTDYTEETNKKRIEDINRMVANVDIGNQQTAMPLFDTLVSTIRLYEVFYPQLIQTALVPLSQRGISLKREGTKYWVEFQTTPTKEDIFLFGSALTMILNEADADFRKTIEGVTLIETEGVQWPAPTLMRYHLFLNEEEKLKGYDYLFYMDADMRVVDSVSDEILGEGLTCAPHPGYAIAPKFIPPYEPNPDSTAYIPRLGRLVEENGKKRFLPFYAAGGFQGGTTPLFIKAMKEMKERIDIDYDNNYTAVWNDESHWNRYLWNNQKDLIYLDPSYVYPDSLVKDYYIPLWGRDYPPKIITLTKPFSLSAQGGSELQKLMSTPK